MDWLSQWKLLLGIGHELAYTSCEKTAFILANVADGPSIGYHYREFYFSSGRVDGKLVVITGAKTDIGRETAAELARHGSHVIMPCRSLERA